MKLTTGRVAKLLDITPRAVRYQADSGRLIAERFGRDLLFDPEKNPEIKKRLEEDHDR
jgi:hypothetical protein